MSHDNAELRERVAKHLDHISLALHVQAGVEAGTHQVSTYPPFRAAMSIAESLWAIYKIHLAHLSAVAKELKETA